MELETSFGRWLRHRRRALDLTQDDLARRVGCSVFTIRKIEADERRPSRQIAELLADSLQIAPDDRVAIITLARAEPYLESAPAEAPEQPLRTSHQPPTNLPSPLTRLIGRKQDIAAVRNALLRGEARLLTLLGPPGIGKTSLTIEVARDVQTAFSDGVSFVALAPLSDPALVLATIAQMLAVKETAGQPLLNRLKAALHTKRMLLVLDNFEHLLDAAPLVVELLEACVGLKALVSSRAALHVRGERLYPVPPLLLPDLAQLPTTAALARIPAVALFVERAQAALPHFQLTDENAAAVAAICVRLEGLPLALELAAARSRLLPPPTLLERLEQRLAVLTDGARDLPPRHRTLRAAIGWSEELLDASEQRLFRRLGVFVDGWTLQAAEAVCNADGDLPWDAVDGLAALLDQSLVRQFEAPDGKPRFTMLETIREYACEKLDESGEAERVRQRHRDFFIAFAEQAEPKLKGAQQLEWLDRLEVEYDNLRAAWNCAIESDAELALRLASAFLEFWSMRGNPSEGRQWLGQLILRTDQWGKTAQRAHVLRVAGQLANYQHDIVAARRLFEQALDIARSAGDKKEIASALLWAAWSALRQHDDQIGWSFSQEALTLYQELQDQWGMAMAFYHLADAAMTQGHYGEAEKFLIKSLATYREVGDNFQVGHVLNALGEVTRLQGDYERAGTFYEETIEILKAQRSVTLLMPLFNLAWVTLHGGDYHRAKALFQESLSLCKEDENTPGLILCLAGLAGVLGMTGNLDQAARLFGAVESLYERVGGGGRMHPADQKEIDQYVAAVRAKLGDSAFMKAWSKGQTMSLDQVLAEALER
jgi:predicted ATPase/DNA-binding XRE family transcriptional regulator